MIKLSTTKDKEPEKLYKGQLTIEELELLMINQDVDNQEKFFENHGCSISYQDKKTTKARRQLLGDVNKLIMDDINKNRDEKIKEKIEYLCYNTKKSALYEARENSLHERANMISSAKEDGYAKGRAKVDIDITKNMLKLGVSIDIIKNATGLSEEKIIELKKEL